MEKVTLVLTRYEESNAEVIELINRLKHQEASFDILFYDQKESEIVQEEIETNGGRYEVIGEAPLGEIRNKGVSHACTDIVIFTDIDVVPSRHWLKELVIVFQRGRTVGVVGGKIIPRFATNSKFYSGLLLSSGFIRSLYGELNFPSDVRVVNKVYGGNLALHKKRLGDQAYIKQHLGRQSGKLIGGEDTDLCDRCHGRGCEIAYSSKAFVYHIIPAKKIRITWMAKGVFYKGFTKAYRKGKISLVDTAASTKALDPFVIPFCFPIYSFGYLWGKMVRNRENRLLRQ